VRSRVEALGVDLVLATHWSDGAAGAEALAAAVLALCTGSPDLRFAYPDGATLWEKASAVATRVYGAAGVTAPASVHRRLAELEEQGYGHLPVCIAKTQYSFSTDPSLRGAPTGHQLDIREVRLAAGAGFVVVVCGDVMTMPGLPRVPAAEGIDLVDGRIVGLF
jgi:formate--tetrahydrofolate ligase